MFEYPNEGRYAGGASASVGERALLEDWEVFRVRNVGVNDMSPCAEEGPGARRAADEDVPVADADSDGLAR